MTLPMLMTLIVIVSCCIVGMLISDAHPFSVVTRVARVTEGPQAHREPNRGHPERAGPRPTGAWPAASRGYLTLNSWGRLDMWPGCSKEINVMYGRP
jgi:hypothetical protein